MEIVSTYSIKIKGYNDVFKPTVHLYRQAVDWYIEVALKEWNDVAAIAGSKARMNYVQRITTSTKDHPLPKYNFTTAFYKFPVYLRRAAIMEAIGKVSSYKENCANRNTGSQGKPPGMPKAGNVYPAFYKDNMFVRAGTYEAKVKVWIRNTWDWLTVRLKKSDADYILHHCTTATECVPTLQKRGKEWFLDF
ncbi:MAG: hypothetical protein IJ225_07915, partial [Solobacterium sp.]|nr:hypothetical protein [Solobacterium sp.]